MNIRTSTNNTETKLTDQVFTIVNTVLTYGTCWMMIYYVYSIAIIAIRHFNIMQIHTVCNWLCKNPLCLHILHGLTKVAVKS